MNIVVMVVLCFPAGEGDATGDSDPISSEQVARMAILIQSTEARDIELKARLEAEQRELTEAYEQFELDEDEIAAIQQRIVATQKELLSNYHKLQAGYRVIVGKRNFPKIKQRIDHYIATTEQRRKKQAASDGHGETDKPAAEVGTGPQ